MYTQTVTIPRITQEQIDALEKVVPSLSSVVKVPLITTEEQALVRAMDLVHSRVPTHEVVTGVGGVVISNDGWTFTLTIMD